MYEKDFYIIPLDRGRIFDLTTFLTWYSENLNDYANNFERIRRITDDGRLKLGIYMYDFGNKRVLSDDQMKVQLDFVGNKLATGEVDGAVLCSNVIAGIGLSTVDITRNWIQSL